MYKLKAPTEIDAVEIAVPTHLPNKIPDRISKGEPNPNSTTHITENAENRMRLTIKFFPIISSKFI